MTITKEFINTFTLRSAICIARLRWTLKKFSTYLRIRLRAFCSSTSSGSHLTLLACKHTNELLSKSAVYWVLAITVIGSCAESDLDPKMRWGSALKGVMGSIELAAAETATGPLGTLCGETPTIPTNCIA